MTERKAGEAKSKLPRELFLLRLEIAAVTLLLQQRSSSGGASPERVGGVGGRRGWEALIDGVIERQFSTTDTAAAACRPVNSDSSKR